jgi:cytoskeletal protein RodZ
MMPAMMLMMILIIIGIVFLIWGLSMHNEVGDKEDEFHDLNAGYWSLSKTERDSAPEGSELNQTLVEIQNFPSELLELKLVGIGRILVGIFFILLAVVVALVMMPVRLGAIIKEHDQP